MREDSGRDASRRVAERREGFEAYGARRASSFRMRSYMEALGTRRVGRLLLWTPLITSTHDLLHQRVNEAAPSATSLGRLEGNLGRKSEDQFVEHSYVTIQGLKPTGYLLATDDDNYYYELHPDGNS